MSKIAEMLGESYDIITSFFGKPTIKTKKKNRPFRADPKGGGNWPDRRKKQKKQLDEIDKPIKKGK